MIDGYYTAIRQALVKAGFEYVGNAKGSHENGSMRRPGNSSSFRAI